MKYILILLALLSASLFAQPEQARWEKADISYEFRSPSKKEYKMDTESVRGFVFSGLKNIYYFTFSDLDGDNCPFHPSCSSFYVSAVKKTNILKATLMFADRFTRDSNLFKSHAQYPHYAFGKLADPVEIYTLRDDIINFIPQKSHSH